METENAVYAIYISGFARKLSDFSRRAQRALKEGTKRTAKFPVRQIRMHTTCNKSLLVEDHYMIEGIRLNINTVHAVYMQRKASISEAYEKFTDYGNLRRKLD